MIELKSFDLHRGGKTLFNQANLTLHKQQKIALIGHNGCGKSTLFQVILSKITIESGHFFCPESWQISHMAQEISIKHRSALDYVIDGHHTYRKLEQDLALAEKQNNHQQIMLIHNELDLIRAYDIRHQAAAILSGLGFSENEQIQSIETFSGGWQIRLNLAQALLKPSDLLLLDEPTNHLDMEAIDWLAGWLKNFAGAILLISHDRDFIDETVDCIAKVDQQKINLYPGSYSDYERQYAEQLAQQSALHEKQLQKKAHLEQFIRRFRAKASKAKQAQSRIKALEKMQWSAPVQAASVYSFTIPNPDKTASPLVNAHDIDMGYDTAVIKNGQFSILSDDRIGLLGANGAGKSTLLKTLTGKITPLSGEVIRADALRIGYFAQHQLDALDYQASPLVHLQRLSPSTTEQAIRDFLGQFNIKGNMAMDSIVDFSGGEKARLALAIVAFQKPNLLILDEPTNHLDIDMRLALTEAIQQFEGAVIIVSHDRYLLRHCVDHFWLIQSGQLMPFDGDLEDYHRLQKGDTFQPSSNTVGDKKKQRQIAAQSRAKLAPIKKQITILEKEIETKQMALDSLLVTLSDPKCYEAENKAELQQLLEQESTLKTAIEMLETTWFEQEELLQQLSQKDKP